MRLLFLTKTETLDDAFAKIRTEETARAESEHRAQELETQVNALQLQVSSLEESIKQAAQWSMGEETARPVAATNEGVERLTRQIDSLQRQYAQLAKDRSALRAQQQRYWRSFRHDVLLLRVQSSQ